GDVAICNDPFVGGTHLPDVSLVSPVFDPAGGGLAGFVGSRAHHADIGGAYPGSMAPTSEVYAEGVIIPPLLLARRGALDESLLPLICRNVRTGSERRGDFAAQLAANETGVRRLAALIDRYGLAEVRLRTREARSLSARAVRALLRAVPAGKYA